MTSDAHTFDRLTAKRREQTPQALARLAILGAFISLWGLLWLAGMPMPRPFLGLLIAEAAFFLAYWRLVFHLPTIRSIELAHYGMLAAEIIFHTAMVYFLGGISWLGSFAYVFGLIFTNTYLDLRRGFVYTTGAALAFVTLIVLEATRLVPHQVYLDESPLRYTDVQLVTTTTIGATGVFFSIYLWVNWVGSQVRRERDGAVRMQDELLDARAALQLTNEQLEARVSRRTSELELVNQALRESEGQLRLVFETCPDLIAIQEPNGRFRYVNGAYQSVLGYSAQELVGQAPAELVHPDDLDEVAEKFRTMVSTMQPGDASYRFRHADGHWATLEANGQVLVNREGDVIGVVVVCRDVSERMAAEEAVRASESTLKATLESTADGILVVDEAGAVAYTNARFAQMWRIPDALLETKDDDKLLEFVLEQLNDPEAFLSKVKQLYQTADEDLDVLTFKDGRVFERYSRPLAREGAILGRVWSFRDITEHRRHEDALREQARRDPLTGVLNHAAIMEELRSLTAGSQNGAHCAIAMVDVDGLKAVNDTYGHQLGDKVLIAVADALARDGALVGRYGGDEFVALLPDRDRTSGELYRERFFESLASAYLQDPETGAPVPVVASIGLAVYPEEADTIIELISLSDSAMYASRRQRIIRPGGLSRGRALGNDHAAEMVGQMVPLLTAAGSLDEKLRLVAHRLSVGAGYDGVDVSLFTPNPGAPAGTNAFAQVPQELVEQWTEDSRIGSEELHPIRMLFERTRRPVIIDRPWESELLLENQRDLLKAAGLPSVLVAPLLWGDDVIGTLGVASKRDRAFAASDAQFLATVATQVTAIIHMASLVEQLQSSSSKLFDAQTETVLMLAAAAEAHDQTTGLHLQSLRALSEALALELGHPAEYAHELGLAASLHDIGKIRVPNSLLGSSGLLSEAEWEVMRRHTTWGSEFLAGRLGFELAATIARSHHERWDGNGYPDGLSRADIPEAARIVTVADAFDAMISDRPYRRGRSIEAALDEIVACAASQFCPDVAEALVRLHDRGELPDLCRRPFSRAA